MQGTKRVSLYALVTSLHSENPSPRHIKLEFKISQQNIQNDLTDSVNPFNHLKISLVCFQIFLHFDDLQVKVY